MNKSGNILISKFKIKFTFTAYLIFTFANAQFEIPLFHGDTEVIKHNGFTLSYSEMHEQSWWVAYELDAGKTRGKTKRSNNFKADPMVSTGSSSLADYKGSGFDRGHLAPAGDMKWSKQSMDDSFYMSNISPQRPGFNRGIWKKLESLIREWVVQYGKLYIATGPVLDKSYMTIGDNKVSIPDYYYKVILDYQNPQYKAIGFMIPNQNSKDHLSNYALSIDKIEAILNIDFFHLLEDSLEASIESVLDLSQWGLAK